MFCAEQHANMQCAAVDITSQPSKHFVDNCRPSLRHGDICANKIFGSVLTLQSSRFLQSGITQKWFPGRSVSISKVARNDSSSGVVFEEGIFENNSFSDEVEVPEETYTETGSDVEDDGLIPNEWKLLQQELYKTKVEKKKSLRLQELENARRNEMRTQFLRQKIEVGEGLGDGDIVLSGQTSVTLSGDGLVKESQQFVENEQLVLECRDTILESPVNTEDLDADFQGGSVLEASFEDVARNQEGRIRTQHQGQKSRAARKGLTGDWDLDLLFTNEEKLSLQRSMPDFSKTYSEKWPALHVLAASGQFFLLEQFFKLGIDINELDEDGYTALQRAVLGRKETAVSQLLRAGADVHICDKDGASLLHYGVQTGSLNLVRLFVKRGVNMNCPDEDGWTPLHVAVLTGRGDIVRHLLVSGADKSLRNKDGLTPLDVCLALGTNFNSYDVARALKKLPKEELLTEPS